MDLWLGMRLIDRRVFNLVTVYQGKKKEKEERRRNAASHVKQQ